MPPVYGIEPRTPTTYKCSRAAICPVCLAQRPCPPLIVLAVHEQEALALSTKHLERRTGMLMPETGLKA